MNKTTYTNPLIGTLTLVGSDRGLAAIHFGDRGATGDPHALAGPIAQLDEYFGGERRAFDLELDLRGSEFQLGVWNELRELPFGETVSYGELARRVGRPDHVRAVAGAVARTPVPIVVPCHRVIGANGSLTGYLGGMERKAALLSLESAVAAAQLAIQV